MNEGHAPGPAGGHHIHFDREDSTDDQRITVWDNFLGVVVWRGRKIILEGVWSLRQYNNPVPCGATVVLYTSDPHATWEGVY